MTRLSASSVIDVGYYGLKRTQSSCYIAGENLRRKETQTAVAWSCLLFIRSGQNHLARHGERGKKTRQTEEEVGRQHQGMDRPGVCQVREGSGEQGKKDETGCEIICSAPTTLAVKGLMMMMMDLSQAAGIARLGA